MHQAEQHHVHRGQHRPAARLQDLPSRRRRIQLEHHPRLLPGTDDASRQYRQHQDRGNDNLIGGDRHQIGQQDDTVESKQMPTGSRPPTSCSASDRSPSGMLQISQITAPPASRRRWPARVRRSCDQSATCTTSAAVAVGGKVATPNETWTARRGARSARGPRVTNVNSTPNTAPPAPRPSRKPSQRDTTEPRPREKSSPAESASASVRYTARNCS